MLTYRLRRAVAIHKILSEGPWPEIESVENLVLPGRTGSWRFENARREVGRARYPRRWVYIHGGGFTYGTLDEFEVPMCIIAERAGIVTYAVEYQLASEAKFLVRIDEIEYFVRWLVGNADSQGVDASKITVGGDSAGGNMTCVIALKLRDVNGPRLALQVPLFPRPPSRARRCRGVRTGPGSTSRRTASMKWCATTSRTRTMDVIRNITPLNASSALPRWWRSRHRVQMMEMSTQFGPTVMV